MAIKTKTEYISIPDVIVTLSGSTQLTHEITWQAPTLPAGAVILSHHIQASAKAFSGKQPRYVKCGSSSSFITCQPSSNTSYAFSSINYATDKVVTSETIVYYSKQKNDTGSWTFGDIQYVINYQYDDSVVDPPIQENVLHIKNGGVWQTVTEVYKKIGNTWVLQNDLPSLFDPSVKYIRKI